MHYLRSGVSGPLTTSVPRVLLHRDHDPTTASVTAKWPHVHNSEEEKRSCTTMFVGGPGGGRVLECEAKDELGCSKKLKVAWAEKQESEVKPTRESKSYYGERGSGWSECDVPCYSTDGALGRVWYIGGGAEQHEQRRRSRWVLEKEREARSDRRSVRICRG